MSYLPRPPSARTLTLWLVGSTFVIGLSVVLYFRAARDLEQRVADRESIRAGLFARLFGQDFRAVSADLLVLAGSDGLLDFLDEGKPEAFARFRAEAHRFSRQEDAYDQIRYIDENGRERFRLSSTDGEVAAAQLQDKSDRDFVKETNRLRLGEVYLSRFDLNFEHGKLERPLKPTLRFATPVFDSDGRRRGMVVINLLGSRQFARFEDLAPAYKHRLRVLNAEGFWLHGARPEDEWGFMLPERADRTLARTAPELWAEIVAHEQGRARLNGGLVTWQRSTPGLVANQAGIPGHSGDPWLVIASELDAAEWDSTVAAVRHSFLVLGLALLTATTAGAGIYEARSRAAIQLRAANNLNAAILQNAGVAVIATRPDGIISAFNPTAEHLLGWSAVELVGKDSPGVFHDDAEVGRRAEELSRELGRPVAPGFEAFVSRARLGERDEREWTYIRRDGVRFPVWLSISRLVDGAGEITGFLCVAVDLTERKQAEQILREAHAAAQESARLKSEFLANMSHEIRTPMNGVVGMSSLLLDTELTAEQRSFANTIRTSADTLLAIINDILDFSKIEAGMLTFEQLPFELRDPVENCLALIAEKAHAKGLELAYLIEDNVPTQLLGDAGRIHQVLLNLVGNAVKFTAQGEVVVRVSHRAGPDGPDRRARLRFTVTDTGIGLTPEASARLFQPFMQGDSSTTRKFGGTGLGLAICRQLVTLMGGEIGVQSEVGSGSTFWFTIELPMQDAALKFIPRKAELAGRHALIVDDHATNREILQHQLAAWQIDTVATAGGDEALAAVRRVLSGQRPFDFALLDMQMPGMDGLALSRQLRAEPGCSALKIIILSSIGRAVPAADLAALRIASALVKPVRQSALHDALVTALVAPTAEQKRAARPALSAGPATDVKPLRLLLAEDNLVNQNVARIQLAKFGYRATIVADGRAAFEKVRTQPIDVILMDCQMPEVDGFEATRLIRAWETEIRAAGERRDPIYIIAMTANAMQGDREACLAAGMDDYVSKPVRPADLAAALARAPAAQSIA